MSPLEKQIRSTQQRLWMNRWLYACSWLLTVAAGVFAATVLVQRLYDLDLPLAGIALGLAGGAALGSAWWALWRRESAELAAAVLDRAAGLRERLSSGAYCRASDDPFAQAVVADAERVSVGLCARRHIRIGVPPPLGMAGAATVAGLLMFLVPSGVLKTSQAAAAAGQVAQVQEAKLAVKRTMDQVRKTIAETPALEALKANLDDLDKQAGGELDRPADLRHEAAKKIDRLADAVRQKRENGNYESVQDMRKMMRGLKVPDSTGVPTERLAKSLAQGDFKTAKEEINALREQLATLKSEEDRELAEKISKQLDDLARQIDKVAEESKNTERLEQLGLTPEQAKRLLEHLQKNDLEQVKKTLEEKGLSRQQVEKMLKQLQQQQNTQSIAKNLSQALKQGAQCNNPGQSGEAISGLTMAGEQLSELERLEQEMNQLDSALAGLNSSRQDMGRPCSACNGRGCPRCQGYKPGGGMGELGQGRGGLAPEEQTAVDFKTERGKVHTGKGAIIGQFLTDGEQVKGDVAAEFSEVVTAAERDASDRINRNRVPRQYQKAVKSYFSHMQQSIEGPKDKKTDSAASPSDSDTADDASDHTPNDR